MAWDRVQEGDGIEALSASFFNDTMDYMERVRMRAGAIPGVEAPGGRRRLVEQAINHTGRNLDRFAVVGVEGLEITPDDNPEGWTENLLLRAVAPHPDKPFGVLLEPLASGRIGDVVTMGSAPIRVNIIDVEHRYAVPAEDEFDRFDSAETGPVRLWHPLARTGTFDTYGSFPVGGGGEPAATPAKLVYTRSMTSAGRRGVSDIYLMTDADTSPNWGANTATHEARVLLGTTPAGE